MGLTYELKQYSKRTNKEVNDFVADLDNMITMKEATIWEGGPGIGKYYILKQILADKGCNVIYRNFTSLSLFGGKDYTIENIFSEAKRKEPSIIVFDEFDLYGMDMTDDNSYRKKRLHRIVDNTIRLKSKPVSVVFVGDRISDKINSTYMKHLEEPRIVHIELDKEPRIIHLGK